MQKVYRENDAVTQSTRGGGRASNLQSFLTDSSKTQALKKMQSGDLTIGTTSSASTATEGESTVGSSDAGTDGLSSDAETQQDKESEKVKHL